MMEVASTRTSFLNTSYPTTNQLINQSIEMEKAKAAVGSFLSKDGKHDTTVHEVRVLATSIIYPPLTSNRQSTQPS